jgi:steroid 5-alpha reductase family enzyme
MTYPIPAPGQAAVAGLILLLSVMTALWFASLATRDASIVDRFWGLGFVLLAWFYLVTSPAAEPESARLILPFAVTLWGVRLSLHIHLRNRGQGEDYRYAAMRSHHGSRFPVVSLFTVFLLQGAILWVVAMPLFAAARGGSPFAGDSTGAARAAFAAGLIVWAIGFAFEAIGDSQLARHRADPALRGSVLDTGLWAYTRHPNYFGDSVVWWGIWIMAASSGGAWTIFSPAVMMMLLVRISGVALLEKSMKDRKPGYADYIRRTPAFFPRLPRPRTR